MSKSRSPTVYLFVNKDSASVSLSRSHGKDASAILSHVQSCRNQKNKQLHMFRVNDSPESHLTNSRPPTPPSSQKQTDSLRSTPTLLSERSPSSSASVRSGSRDNSASPRPNTRDHSPEVDELVHYFDSVSLKSEQQTGVNSDRQDLYHQIVASEDFRNFSRGIAQGIHGTAMLACTAARMSAEMPDRREEFEIKATKYMQPSLQYLREQLANPQTRTLTDRQILQEMLLHCGTNWYLRDFTAAQTHLNAVSYFSGCLNVSRSSDRKLMDIINRCGLCITNAQKAEQYSQRNSVTRIQYSDDRALARVV